MEEGCRQRYRDVDRDEKIRREREIQRAEKRKKQRRIDRDK